MKKWSVISMAPENIIVVFLLAVMMYLLRSRRQRIMDSHLFCTLLFNFVSLLFLKI